MPFVYHVDTAVVATNFTTSGTTNTEVDQVFIAPKATVPTRSFAIIGLYVGGKANALTAISGIAYRLKKFPTTASSGGTAIVPTPRDGQAPAALSTSGGASAGVTSGTGTPVYIGGCTSGAAGPGQWVALNPDAAILVQGGATNSVDLFTASQLVSAAFEAKIEFSEG